MGVFIREKSLAYRIRDDGELTIEAFGPLHKPDNGTEPLLEWGSISKTVTAHLAQRLHDAGVIGLDDPVTASLPQTRLPETVTIRTLAEHTSGLPRLPKGLVATRDEAKDPYAKYTHEYFDREVLPQLALWHNPEKVGTMGYSNLGYAVLTRALEEASDMGWWSLAKTHVFDSLGIADVACAPDTKRSPVLYNRNGSVRAQWTDTGPFIGAGGVHSSFDALEHYATAIAATSPGMKPLGWMEDKTLFWHNGHNRDHGAFVGVSPDSSRTITVHTLGYLPGRADKTVRMLERQFPQP